MDTYHININIHIIQNKIIIAYLQNIILYIIKKYNYSFIILSSIHYYYKYIIIFLKNHNRILNESFLYLNDLELFYCFDVFVKYY